MNLFMELLYLELEAISICEISEKEFVQRICRKKFYTKNILIWYIDNSRSKRYWSDASINNTETYRILFIVIMGRIECIIYSK